MIAPVRFERGEAGGLWIYLSHSGPTELHVAPLVSREFDDRDRYAAARAAWTPVPGRVTLALDSAGVAGPEVDEALGVAEPTVDQWEAGEASPTREEVGRLATLTGYPPAFFYSPLAVMEGPSFACGDDGCELVPPARWVTQPLAVVIPLRKPT